MICMLHKFQTSFILFKHVFAGCTYSTCTEFPMTKTKIDPRPMQIQMKNPHTDYKRSEAAI